MKNNNSRFKKYCRLITFMALFFGLAVQTSIAQEGETCDDPLIIQEMPFEGSGNTADYGNNYSGNDIPPEAEDAITEGTGSTGYFDGYDVIYEYTPSESGDLDLELDYESTEGWGGLYVFSGCPFESTLAYHTSTSGFSRSISGIPVEEGETYYIGISNWFEVNMEYTLNLEGPPVGELEDCEEAVAGDVEDIDICAGIAFTLSTEGVSTAEEGLSYQWEESENGDDWTEIEGANGKNHPFPEGIEEPMFYRLVVSCEFGDSDTSDPIEVSINAPEDCYCTPTTTGDWSAIDDFTATGDLGQNIENLGTGAGESGSGYSDFTNQVVQITASQDLEYSVSILNFDTAGLKIWVDWGKDGNFNNDDELMFESSGYSGDYSGTFQIPEDADGEYIMRIGSSYTPDNGPNDACTHSGQGEYEDYTIEVIPLEDCEGTPTAGDIMEDFSVCSEVAFELEIEGASGSANNLTRVWQSSPAGEDDWTDLSDSNQGPNITIEEGINEETDFRYMLQCGDDDPVYSDVVSITLNDPEECYCEPVGTNSNRYINNFSAEGNGDSNIENTDSGFSDEGYGDFTNITVTADPDDVVTFSADIEGGTAGFRIWVDWNNSGNFDPENDVVYQSDSYQSNHSGEFEIPEDATGEYRMRIVSNWSSTTADVDPCETGYSLGEFEDYTLDVIPLEDCEGTPVAGDIIEDFSVCAEIAFNLETEGASGSANNLTRVWQSSPAGEDDWTDLSDSNQGPDITIEEGINEETNFRYVLQCGDDDPVYSDVVSVSLNAPEECYCTPLNTSSSSNYITKVKTSGASDSNLNKSSGFSEDGYADYTESDTLKVVSGDEIELTTTYEGGTSYTEVWVDWDLNGNFEGENDHVLGSGSYTASPYTGTFEIPTDITEELITRIRVRVQYLGGSPDSCEESGYGETEDYTIKVTPLEDCEGTPVAGEIMDDFSICADNGFSIETTGASIPAHNLTRVWQSSPAGEDDWTDLSEENQGSNITIEEGIQENTDFRYKLQCGDDDPVYSDVLEVSLKPGYECYCIPEGANDNADEIVNFSINDFSNDSEPSESENGYSDYSDLGPIQLIPGVEYVASLTSGSGSGNHGAAIWIDYNDDGIFSEDEKVATIPSSISANETAEFPEFIAGNETGEHRMRVQYTYAQDGENLDPCNISTTYSETEDYTVLIVDVDCFPPTNIEINYVTDNSAQVSWEANDESEWMVIYGEDGFDPETEGETITVENPVAELIDLDEETSYEVYVQTLCDGEDSIIIGPNSFTTNITPPENTRLCDAIALEANDGCADGPYTNVAAFEESNEPTGSCLNDFHGTNSVWFTFVAPANGLATISTDFNSTDFLTEIVAFEAPEDCEDMNTLGEEVGCANASDDDTGILELEGLTPGDTYYVKIAGFNQTEGEFCIEVEMDETEPVCPEPTNINIHDIDYDSAVVSWDANGADQWEVIYGEDGFDVENDGEITIVDSPEAVLTDLEDNTDYQVYIRAICDNISSDWMGPESFTTKDMAVENHYFENFTFYPNPVENQLNLKADTQIEKVEVFNLLGQKVIDSKPNVLETQINTEKLQSGVYLMKVNIDGNQKTFRVVKK